jgi:dihydropyrimidinase
VKVQGSRIDDTTGGHAGHEARMGIVYTEAVARRGFSLERFVDLTSANAARFFGLYPRKGALAPDSDADVAIIDPTIKKTLSNDDLHETDYSPWEGWEIEGWPVATIRRGKVVVENGQLTADLSDGQRIPRKVADSVLRR